MIPTNCRESLKYLIIIHLYCHLSRRSGVGCSLALLSSSSRVQRLLHLLSSLLVELQVLHVVGARLEVLESSLPDAAESRSRIVGNARPGGLRAEELDASGLGGQSSVETTSGAGNAAELTDILECVVSEDVLGDERAAVEDHEGLGLLGAAVSNDGGLREDLLLECVAAAIVDCDLDLLHNKHDGADILELILEVALAEEVVEVVVEAVVDLVNDEGFLDLLDNLLLEAVVGDLKVLLLDLDHLLLLVEVAEAISEVESIAAESVYDGAIEAIAEDVVAALGVARKGLRGVDGLCSYGVSVLFYCRKAMRLNDVPARPVASARVAKVLNDIMKM